MVVVEVVEIERDRHAAYVHSLDKDKESFEYHATEHLRVSGIYWSLSAMHLLERTEEMDRDGILAFVASCQGPNGGFGGGPSHDPHMLYTLSALQIVEILRATDECAARGIDRAAAAAFVASLQNADGSFRGDEWGEVDTRFSYCATQASVLLAGTEVTADEYERVRAARRCGAAESGTPPASCAVDFSLRSDAAKRREAALSLPESGSGGGGDAQGAARRLRVEDLIDVSLAAEHLAGCRNFDGGFGTGPGAESHAGQIFCCVGALAMLGRLDVVDTDLLSWWLCERQLPCGGLNGRPEKKEDVCYSWWVLSSLMALGRDHWIDGAALSSFIVACEDKDDGGFSDRPGDVADVFHTFFALAGLSMLGTLGKAAPRIDPVTALPLEIARTLPGAHRWLRE